jgi:gliding motility-associated-like protein
MLQVISPYGCTSFDSVVVTVYAPVVPNPGQDTTICNGEAAMLGGSAMIHNSSFTPSYEWFPKASLDNAFVLQPVATPDSTTTYTLIVKTGDCTTDTTYVTVFVSDPPEVKASADTTIGFGEIIQLKAEGGVQYHWFPSDGLSRTDIADPFASPNSTTTYVMTGYNSYGCSRQDSVTIYVDNRVFIPNLFSPNQDVQNDTFKVYGAGIETLALQVYDISGKQVYNSTDVQEIMETGWDGTFHGLPLASGTYLWVIQGRFYDGKAVMFEGKTSGKIRLIR